MASRAPAWIEIACFLLEFGSVGFILISGPQLKSPSCRTVGMLVPAPHSIVTM